MEKEFFELLIHREITGEISVKDQHLLSEWVGANEVNEQEYEAVKAIWTMSTVEDSDLLGVNMEAQLSKIQGLIEAEVAPAKEKVVQMTPKRKNKFPWMKIAAGFILVLGAVMVIRTFSTNTERSLVETTGNGQVETIDMMDGSSILMNENAAVTFFPHIKSERRLALEGEAFFDVARNESKPFIIETSNAVIKVLGTSFKVSNQEANETTVEVRHGKVQVTPKKGGESVILTKGQKVSLQDEFSAIQSFSDNTLAGFEGLLEFNNTSWEEAMQHLEQKFGKKINWNRNLFAGCELNGNFEGKSLENIITLLETSFQLENVVFDDTQITLTGGTCK